MAAHIAEVALDRESQTLKGQGTPEGVLESTD